ncbi:arsenic resistance protein [Leptothermofonsia sichuanensis E412]|uniref:arsenic resistance protein n=1 Tax=Leptothermofonsia sichuanensis TaxID=2917832 RepID=UPI001CA7A9D8|nr:arsenic resistance protein [Leptothermofonsia sichuanensis]QZZ21184.1 arsenic resistance protein [Leptothermofonsia sichuanensis E412]
MGTTLFERLQPVLILLSVAVGLGLAPINGMASIASGVIVPLLGAMLYATFLPLSLKHFGQSWKTIKVTAASLMVNFVWTPLLAWGLGALFLRAYPDLWVGLIMLLVTPCTDWYIVFTSVARGDVALATALLPLNLVLQVVLLPLYLLLFAGTLVELELTQLFESLFWVLLVPLGLATLTRWGQGQGYVPRSVASVLGQAEPFQVICLNLAIVAIFAAEGSALVQNPDLLLRLLMPLGLFFGINFALGLVVGCYGRFSYPELACFSCTTLARNSPLSLAIAASAFPHRPFIAIALIIGPLIELPVLALISQILLWIRRRGLWPHL